MDAAEIAWVVVGCVVALLGLIFFIRSIPEIRRYLNVRKM
jgi:predicted membrane channel-forming protein YqfA (hemolysin III family)